MKQWKNAHAQFIAELCVQDHQIVDTEGNLVAELAPYSFEVLEGGGAELVISFRSTGHHDPGSLYGGPDGLGWPPSEDDERLPDSAVLIMDGGIEIELCQCKVDAMFDRYISDIYNVELDCEE